MILSPREKGWAKIAFLSEGNEEETERGVFFFWHVPEFLSEATRTS